MISSIAAMADKMLVDVPEPNRYQATDARDARSTGAGS